MFAAMDYNARVGRPANWIALPNSTPNATPSERFYGFSHQRDQGVNFAILSTQIWPAYGMDAFGPVVNVDDTAPPYHNSHMLTSNLEAPTQNYHGCIVVDRHLVLLPDGTPVYKPVWEYLLGAIQTMGCFQGGQPTLSQKTPICSLMSPSQLAGSCARDIATLLISCEHPTC